MDDRRVLVTGANAGLGQATCLELARRGVVGTVRSEEKAALVRAAAAQAGVEADTRLLDIDDADGCAAVIHEVRPWGLVNNAGIAGLLAVLAGATVIGLLILTTVVGVTSWGRARRNAATGTVPVALASSRSAALRR